MGTGLEEGVLADDKDDDNEETTNGRRQGDEMARTPASRCLCRAEARS